VSRKSLESTRAGREGSTGHGGDHMDCVRAGEGESEAFKEGESWSVSVINLSNVPQCRAQDSAEVPECTGEAPPMVSTLEAPDSCANLSLFRKRRNLLC
jgi:hypothetical protein